MSGEPAVSFRGVTKTYRVYHEHNQTLKHRLLRGRSSIHDDFVALDDVTLDVRSGSTFGLVGSNGAGKSTMLKLAAGIVVPDRGTVVTRGRVGALLELGAGFHGELTGRENIILNGTLLGMRRSELQRRAEDIVEFAGVGEHIDNPVKTYSSGMVARLGFAIAIHVEPEILLLDEVLAVGDATFQARCRQKIDQMRGEGHTIVVVSHSLSEVRRMCDDAAWIDHGKVRAAGPCDAVLGAYLASEVVVEEATDWPDLRVALRIEPGDDAASSTDPANELAVLQSGRPYRIVVSVSGAAGHRHPKLLRVAFRSSDGTSLATIDTPPLDGSTDRWSFLLSSLPFLGGPILATVHAVGPDDTITELKNATFRFLVEHPYPAGRDHGLIELRGGWDA